VWASDDEDQTPELAKIGKQPRRDRGEAEPEPFPDPAGTATFDAATSTLSVPALPAHATSLRAFRKPAGGTAELAGTSTTTTVSVIAAGPLTPGVTYEFWLAGHNFRGDGPESNHVTHAVPVGPREHFVNLNSTCGGETRETPLNCEVQGFLSVRDEVDWYASLLGRRHVESTTAGNIEFLALFYLKCQRHSLDSADRGSCVPH